MLTSTKAEHPVKPKSQRLKHLQRKKSMSKMEPRILNQRSKRKMTTVPRMPMPQSNMKKTPQKKRKKAINLTSIPSSMSSLRTNLLKIMVARLILSPSPSPSPNHNANLPKRTIPKPKKGKEVNKDNHHFKMETPTLKTRHLPKELPSQCRSLNHAKHRRLPNPKPVNNLGPDASDLKGSSNTSPNTNNNINHSNNKCNRCSNNHSIIRDYNPELRGTELLQ